MGTGSQEKSIVLSPFGSNLVQRCDAAPYVSMLFGEWPSPRHGITGSGLRGGGGRKREWGLTVGSGMQIAGRIWGDTSSASVLAVDEGQD